MSNHVLQSFHDFRMSAPHCISSDANGKREVPDSNKSNSHETVVTNRDTKDIMSGRIQKSCSSMMQGGG